MMPWCYAMASFRFRLFLLNGNDLHLQLLRIGKQVMYMICIDSINAVCILVHIHVFVIMKFV